MAKQQLNDYLLIFSDRKFINNFLTKSEILRSDVLKHNFYYIDLHEFGWPQSECPASIRSKMCYVLRVNRKFWASEEFMSVLVQQLSEMFIWHIESSYFRSVLYMLYIISVSSR